VSEFLRSNFPVMGTMASIVVSLAADDERAARAISAAEVSLQADEQRFSHYRSDSDISRWSAGHSVSPEAVAEIDHVLTACAALRTESQGAFRVNHPVTGALDTAGYVKGYAIAKAARRMLDCGVTDFVINVGGDAQAYGRAAIDRPWRIAIAHPFDRHRIVELIESTNGEPFAVATSGTAERGAHIWSSDACDAGELISLSVTGPDITLADAYATAGFAMGEAGIDWVSAHGGYRCIAIRADGTVLANAALVSIS